MAGPLQTTDSPFRIEFEFTNQEQFLRVCVCVYLYQLQENSCEKRELCVSNSKSMVLSIFHVCVTCIEFISQAPKQKLRMYVFLLGWYFCHFRPMFGLFRVWGVFFCPVEGPVHDARLVLWITSKDR